MTAGAPLPDKELTERIIAAAMEVHRTLGPGFLESVYEEALCVELRYRGLPVERQKEFNVRYRGEIVGKCRLDLFIDGKVVVELKAVKAFEPVFFAVVRSYLNAADVETGLLINFNAIPLAIKRIGRKFYGHSK